MPGKYASANVGLRFAMALLFLVSAGDEVREKRAIQAYRLAGGKPCGR
ncbi:MAG: hypothetical protein JOZ11_13905 [Alphaproteobacteria bacterium]|nr:hypothetical protein [Alphaproteobacteria bacterium]